MCQNSKPMDVDQKSDDGDLEGAIYKVLYKYHLKR